MQIETKNIPHGCRKENNIAIAIEGSIGDTIVVLPIIKAIRKYFQSANVGIIHFGQGGRVSEEIVMHDIPLVDFWFTHPTKQPGLGRVKQKIKVFVDRMRLALILRRKRITTLIVGFQMFTYSPTAIEKAILKIRRFAKLSGIKQIVGLPEVSEISPLDGNANVTERLRELLKKNGIPIEKTSIERFKIPFSQQELDTAECLAKELEIPSNMRPFAICIGGKSECNHWPSDSWKHTLKILNNKLNLFPIFFDSSANEDSVNNIMRELNFPFAFVSEKKSPSIRTTMALMQKVCHGYIGHDTGLLHAASCVGLSIIGIYSAHDYNGLWFPRKTNTRVILRKNIGCEGCGYSVCPKNNLCISSISPEEVISATLSVFNEQEQP